MIQSIYRDNVRSSCQLVNHKPSVCLNRHNHTSAIKYLNC